MAPASWVMIIDSPGRHGSTDVALVDPLALVLADRGGVMGVSNVAATIDTE